MSKSLNLLALLLLAPTLAMAASTDATCTTTRYELPQKKSTDIALAHNAIFERNNPGKQELNAADKTFPYGINVVLSDSNSDVSIIITDRKNNYSQSVAEGALNSNGTFEAGVTINGAGNQQDLITVSCKANP